jgi:subfamily B ATP-binding cassette protein HlyB/CyaB
LQKKYLPMTIVYAVDAMDASHDMSSVDGGLEALCLLVTVLGERLDPTQLRHENLEAGKPALAHDIVRIARREGYKARQARSSVARLGQMPLPAIGVDRAGAFFIIAKVTEERVLIARPRKPVVEVATADLENVWDGTVIFITRREALGGDALRFGLAWFLPIVKRFRHISRSPRRGSARPIAGWWHRSMAPCRTSRSIPPARS